MLNPVKTNPWWNENNCSKSISTLSIFVFFFLFTTPLFSQTTDTTKTTKETYEPLDKFLTQALTPDGKGNITFTPGLRIQTRYDLVDSNNDFYINRLRLKGGGKVFDVANYYFEVKIDGTGKFNRTPRAQVENAWLDFKINTSFIIRAGLFDDVFSRNALTSDSKLLLMDRSKIKDVMTAIGITDNTVGILLHGRPFDGHLSYGIGVFDNLGFEVLGQDTTIVSRKSNGAMVSGRVGYDFLDPASPGGYGDYRGSYIGQGKRLTVSGNAAYLSKAQIGDQEFTLYAFGFDVFFNMGKFVFEAEYNEYFEDFTDNGAETLDGKGWYAQAGYMIFPKIELAARYQELDPDNHINDDKIMWSTIGVNYYIRGHNLKVQGEYTFRKEQGTEINDNDLFQVQLQLDF